MRRKRRLFQHRREVSQCHCLYLSSISTNLDSMFHSSLELDDKYAEVLRVMNEKLSAAEAKLSKSGDRIKDLEGEKKILEKEKAELVSRCQRYDENAQQHMNELEKMRLAHVQKAELKVIEMDTSNLKKQKATQSMLEEGRQRVAALSNIFTSRTITPTNFSALVHPQQHEPSAMARTEALQAVAPHYGVQQPHHQQYTNPMHPVGYTVGGGGTQPQLQQQPFVQQQQFEQQQYQQQQYPPNHTMQPHGNNVGGPMPPTHQQQYLQHTMQPAVFNVGGGGTQQQQQLPPQYHQNMQRRVFNDGDGGAGAFGRFCLLHIRIL
jgi:hypothetical protein